MTVKTIKTDPEIYIYKSPDFDEDESIGNIIVPKDSVLELYVDQKGNISLNNVSPTEDDIQEPPVKSEGMIKATAKAGAYNTYVLHNTATEIEPEDFENLNHQILIVFYMCGNSSSHFKERAMRMAGLFNGPDTPKATLITIADSLFYGGLWLHGKEAGGAELPTLPSYVNTLIEVREVDHVA